MRRRGQNLQVSTALAGILTAVAIFGGADAGPLTCAEQKEVLAAVPKDTVTLTLSGGSLACREHCAQNSECHFAEYDSGNDLCTLYDSTTTTQTGTDIIIWKSCPNDLADTVKPVTMRGMGCAETNLNYNYPGSGTPTPNVFDPEVCYELCMGDATCILAVHDGVNNMCTMQTRFEVPFVADETEKLTALYKYCNDAPCLGTGLQLPVDTNHDILATNATADHVECADKCRSVYGCVASHFTSDNSTNTTNCVLKHTADAAGATAASGDYTWFANCPTDPANATTCSRPNTGLNGPDLKTTGDSDAFSCGASCRADPECVASVFDSSVPECKFKARIGEMVYDTNMETTMRNCPEFGRDFFVYGGARYEAFTAKKTYGEALAACGARGGNLVEIFDAELNAIVVGGMQQLVGASLQGDEYLIGVTPNVNGWGTGAALDYTKWCSSAPAAGSSVVIKMDGGKYCWDGIDTTAQAGFICQISECQRRVSPRTAIPGGDNQDSTDLANKDVGCPERTLLTEFGLDKVEGGDDTAYVYECCAFPKGRSCSASAKVDNAYTDYANAGNDGNAEKLADQVVDCAAGKVLSSLKLEDDTGAGKWRYSYDCCTADVDFAKCYDYTTAQKDSQSYKQEGLTELPISCPDGQYLNKFQYRPSNSDLAISNKTRYSFSCCSYDAHTPPATDGDFHHVTKNGECYLFSKSRTHSYSQMGGGVSKEIAALTCEGIGATLLDVSAADVNEILVNATTCHLADDLAPIGVVIDDASAHANFNGTDNGDGVVVVVDSSSGKWRKYDVAEASTLWTHVACKKAGACADSLPWQTPCEELPVPGNTTGLELVNTEPVCNKESFTYRCNVGGKNVFAHDPYVSEVTYTCDSYGMIPAGITFEACTDEPTYCSAFGSHNVSSDGSYGISNGEIKCSDPDGVNELKANTSCVLHCNEGFQPMGVSVTKCLQDPTTKAHKWSDPESLMSCTMSINVLIGGLDAKHQYLKSAEVYTPNHRGDCKFGTELTDFPFPVMGAVGGQVNGIGMVCGGAMEAYNSCSNVPGDIGAKDCASNLEKARTKGNTVWATGVKSKACYSYQQREWKKVVELREPRAYASAVSMPDGSLWIMGGMGVDGPLSSIEVVSMDTETGAFKAKRSMVAMRKSVFGHCAVLSKAEGKIVVTGGFLDGQYSGKVESYNVEGGYWATEPFTLLEPRTDHSCIMGTARNTSVVVVSGGGNELGIINTTETRNPVSYEWTKAKPDTDRQLKPEYLNNAGVANSRRAGVAISENGVVYQVSGVECAFDNAKNRAVCSKPSRGLNFVPSAINGTRDDWSTEDMTLIHPRSSAAVMQLPKSVIC